MQLNPKTPIIFLHFLRKLHAYWRDQLEGLGYETSTGLVLGNVIATPWHQCSNVTGSKSDMGAATGPRVIDAVMPDFVSLDLDAPLGFPNGRPPWEPISDKILAMGFLKMGGKCPGNTVCTIETFSDLPLQVAKNDRPFKPTTFPYLAEPWFYRGEGEASYYWPTTPRLESPE
ncbi:MAG: hypothetical protein U0169_27315 [Polyangiaceae bacterium]